MQTGTIEVMRIQGRDRYSIGADAARKDGLRTRLLVRLATRVAKGRPPARVRFSDEVRAEAEGAARVLGMQTDDLLAARSIIEPLAMSGCTNFGAVPPATKDEEILLSWNFDAAPPLGWLVGRTPMYVRDLDGCTPYVCFGNPVLFGIGVMNAEGLCCTVNAVGMLDDGEGLSPFELNNRAMETCSRVDEAAAIFEAGPRGVVRGVSMAMLLNWNTIWGDLEGSLALVEYSHSHFNKQPAPERGSIASANHHQFLDQSLTGSPDPLVQPLIAGSYSRLGRMYTLLEQHHGVLDPWIARQIITDHMPDYSLLEQFGIRREWWERRIDNATICAHAWNLRHHLLRGELAEAVEEVSFSTTLFSMQMQPRSSTVWVTVGHPCRNLTTPIWFGGLLGTGSGRPEAAEEPRGGTEVKQQKRRGMFRDGMSRPESALEDVWTKVIQVDERIALKKLKPRGSRT